MSYDFVLLDPARLDPALLAADGRVDEEALEAAVEVAYLAEEGDEPALPAAEALVRDLLASGAADEDAGWLSIEPEPTSVGVIVCTTYADVARNQSALLRLASRHGLALVDGQSATVHRPRTGAVVAVQTGAGEVRGALEDEAAVRELVAGMRPPDPWLVLERDDHVYAQAYRERDEDFAVEHRDGGPDRHFRLEVSGDDAVAALLWSWAQDDQEWRERPWEAVVLDDPGTGPPA